MSLSLQGTGQQLQKHFVRSSREDSRSRRAALVRLALALQQQLLRQHNVPQHRGVIKILLTAGQELRDVSVVAEEQRFRQHSRGMGVLVPAGA